jgi:hypothetical protein
MYQIFKDLTRGRNTQNIVNVEQNSDVEENWRFGSFIELAGHSSIMVPLNSDQSFTRGYFSKSSNSTRNYLFVNTQTLDRKWLFNHTDYLIEQARRLSVKEYNSEEPVLAILYSLVKLDSNEDNRLTASDLTTVAISKPDGSGYVEVLNDIEKVIDTTLLSDKELFFMYQANGISYSAVLDLKTFSISNQKKLPKVGV